MGGAVRARPSAAPTSPGLSSPRRVGLRRRVPGLSGRHRRRTGPRRPRRIRLRPRLMACRTPSSTPGSHDFHPARRRVGRGPARSLARQRRRPRRSVARTCRGDVARSLRPCPTGSSRPEVLGARGTPATFRHRVAPVQPERRFGRRLRVEVIRSPERIPPTAATSFELPRSRTSGRDRGRQGRRPPYEELMARGCPAVQHRRGPSPKGLAST